jgi:hypothetical protein
MWIPIVLGMALFARAAVAGQTKEPADRILTAYVSASSVPLVLIAPAKRIATRLFETAGVRVRWRNGDPPDSVLRSEGAVAVRILNETPLALQPGAYGYALPYEGHHVTLFLDRLRCSDTHTSDAILAHVLVHEITHLLQGMTRHSESGIMKRRWTHGDYKEMRWRGLSFTTTDVSLIRRGMEGRMKDARAAREAQTAGLRSHNERNDPGPRRSTGRR